jgi:hypothetical protein
MAACWRSQPPSPTPHEEPLVVASATGSGTGSALAAVAPRTTPGTCGRDQVREMLCGGMGIGGTDPCGPAADSLGSAGYQRLAITSLTHGMKGEPVLKEFLLDDAETQSYRAGIPPSGAGLPGPYCCYARCTPYIVAAKAPAQRATPGHHLAEACFPPPPAGTSAPASDPVCPAALEFLGELRPYRGAMVVPAGAGSPWWYRANGGASCCYTYVAVDPPPSHGHDLCPTCKCAAAGTPIATPTGEVAIETLAPGDLVMSMHAGRLQPVPLRAVHREPVHDHVMVVVTLANGRQVAMSPRHPTADGHRFQDLAIGSILGDVRVVAVERVPYTGSYTYDLLPDSDTATYVASGALVGSTLK